MRGVHRRFIGVLSLAAMWSLAGCAYTVAGTKLPAISPPKPSVASAVEYTVGDFAFTLDGGKMVTSNFVGRTLSEELLNSWKDRGYILDSQYVHAGAFSRTADFHLTLNGSQYGESDIVMQILSGLTLTLFPYSVTQHYDLQYTLEDVKTGKKYSASVQETDETYVEFFLLFTLPVAGHGHSDTVQRMGDHLYEQFRSQGAFTPAAEDPGPGQ